MSELHGHKALALVRVKAAGAPTPTQLEQINRYTLREVSAEDVQVREFVIAHNGIDRDGESFDPALLDTFAATLPGKGLFIRHPSGWDGDSGPGEGRFFAARSERMSIDQAKIILRDARLKFPPDAEQAVLVYAEAYLAKGDPLHERLDLGIAGDVSIGFTASGRSDITDDNGDVIARRLHAPGEALEASLVWLGAQPGARAVKGAKSNPREETTVEQKEFEAKLADLQAKLDAANAKAAEVEAATKGAADFVAGVTKALGDDHKALAADPAALAKAAVAGVAYRARLVDDIIAGERAKGVITDDTPENIEAVKAIYAGADIKVLEARADAVRVSGKAGITGGDPNAPRPGVTTDLPDALNSVAI